MLYTQEFFQVVLFFLRKSLFMLQEGRGGFVVSSIKRQFFFHTQGLKDFMSSSGCHILIFSEQTLSFSLQRLS